MIEKNNISVFCRLFFVMISFFTSYVYSSEVTEKNATEHEALFLTFDIFPYGYIKKSGNISGIWYDILDKITMESGLVKTHQIVPTKRLLRYINTEQKVCTIISDGGKETAHLDLLEPIGQKLSAGILPRKRLEIKSYEDLKDILIAVPLGIKFRNAFDNDLTITKIDSPQYLNAIKMFSRGRVDAVAGAVEILKHVANVQGIKEEEFDEPLIFQTTNAYLACTFGVDKTIRNKLRSALVRLKKKGVINKMLTQYFPSS
jgi:ABC-type amino acid transport substrate-binding protein